MAWSMEQQIVEDSSARHVLLCLANYADRVGKNAFPSVNTLVEHTRLSERTVRSKLASLEQGGVIVRGNQAIVAAYVERADQRPICYDLNMSRGAVVAGREERGADFDGSGCNPCRNEVQMTQERGAAVAPNPSFNPSTNPSLLSDSKFEEAWKLYPKREGGNSKQAALKAWNARVREGIHADLLVSATKAYAVAMKTAGNVGTRYVRQASTFFGPDRHFEAHVKSVDPQEGPFQSAELADNWWTRAGFRNEWDAMNAGCTERNSVLWRDGRPTRRLAGANVEPWPETTA
ncbi:helix-turn-helix protein [Paraburkholderia sp. BL18I3N2]|nr:helix-turn-helix protein [Paraburkholderia sp. BL18I3N2]